MSSDFKADTWKTDEKNEVIESYIRDAGPEPEPVEDDPVEVEKTQNNNDEDGIIKSRAQESPTPKQPKPSSNLLNIFTPSPNINYDFITSVYGGFALLGLALYLLETLVLQKHLIDEDKGNSTSTDTNETMKELAESTQGLYLIFAPFSVCFLWSLVVRKEWKRITNEKQKQE